MTLNSYKKSIKLIDIDASNMDVIRSFLGNCNKSLDTFRYFSSRDILKSLENHKSTIILMHKNDPIGYAHLDRDSEYLWLGICVADNYIGRGFGDLLMSEILSRNKPKENITLTVDRNNKSAINLYKKHGFVEVGNYIDLIKMELSK